MSTAPTTTGQLSFSFRNIAARTTENTKLTLVSGDTREALPSDNALKDKSDEIAVRTPAAIKKPQLFRSTLAISGSSPCHSTVVQATITMSSASIAKAKLGGTCLMPAFESVTTAAAVRAANNAKTTQTTDLTDFLRI